EGKGKRRNPLHDFKKTGELMLIKVNKTLEIKTKLPCVIIINHTEFFFSHPDFLCRAFAYDRVTKRCHWLSFNSLTNGVRKKQDHAFDLYEKKDYVRNCIIGKGADYKGTISVTKSGIQCQAWNSMIPHEH
ncbi:Hepatocyte growth factor, partial [Buceros rhinoceros silvestris]